MMQMDSMKPWYYSRTVWGALIAVSAPMLQLMGLPISPQIQPELADGLVTFVGAVGGLVALYGRLFATSQLR
jgi:hypothetical protein